MLDKDVEVCENDLKGDECEIEMRMNMVVQLLLNITYCYMKLFFFDEAKKCLEYIIDICPLATDAYLRRSQLVMYDKESNYKNFEQAIKDADYCI